MIRFLLLISILLAQFSVARCQEYNVTMQARGQEMTGVCIMENASDGSLVSTLLTEMGVKIFDFTYSNGKAKVMNVIAPLNKWYIRRVLRKDMQFIVENMRTDSTDAKDKKGRRVFNRGTDGSFKMSNNKYKIYYSFDPIVEKE